MVHVNIASIIFFPPENCFALCMCQWCINTLICNIIFEQIICSDFGITMCSVLQSPMPSAPFLRAANASSGVSAFAITWSNDSRYRQSNCSDAYLQNFGKLSLILVWQESMYKMKNVKTTYIYILRLSPCTCGYTDQVVMNRWRLGFWPSSPATHRPNSWRCPSPH